MQEHECHQAIVRISPEFLRRLLFPEGTRILKIIEDPKNVFTNREPDILVKIEHLDLPMTDEGMNYPEIAPSYTQHFLGTEGEIPTVTFDSWGI